MQRIAHFFKSTEKSHFEVEENPVKSVRFFSHLFTLTLLLGLATWIIYLFNIEVHLGLPKLMPFVWVAFVLNALLPRVFRLSFFFFASLVPIFYAFGFVDASLLIVTALTMIGACHLPISIGLRRACVVAIGAALAYTQYQLYQTGFIADYALTSQFVSLLGVMFMFRMIIYLYDLPFEKEKVSIWQRLSYFFMLPNICFPIFPVVDYKTFKMTYYDESEIEIYQKGMHLIVLGIIQLLTYRVMYYIVPSANGIGGFWDLVLYLLLSYFMLLRLNGILNIAIGILRLFGFNLPDIFNYMFLAQGFDDYWRKLNIYWKDFMVKIFYYPTYFRFRKRNVQVALILATFVTLFLNWLLHTYQWIWIMGKVSIRTTEILVWAVLCVLVLAPILIQTNNKKRPKVQDEAKEDLWGDAISKGVSIFYTIAPMTLIYALYISPNLDVWLSMLGKIGHATIVDWLILIAIVGSGIFLIALGFVLTAQGKFGAIKSFFDNRNKTIVLQFAILGGLYLLTTSTALEHVQQISSVDLKMYIKHDLNQGDKEKQSRGYYEEMLLSDNFSSPLWQMENRKPKTWINLRQSGGKRTNGLLEGLVPDTTFVFKRGKLTSNSHGLRDKEYALKRPDNTIRLAIVGGSLEMGSGVDNEEVFENLTEHRLNTEYGSDSLKFEIINFGLSGLSAIRNVEKLRKEVLRFEPQYVIVAVHDEEVLHFQKTLRWIEKVQKNPDQMSQLREESPWVVEFEEFLKTEGITYSPASSIGRKKEEGIKILNWCYGKMKASCLEKNSKMILSFMPDITHRKENYPLFENIATEQGVDIFDLGDVFDGYKEEDLEIARWDKHPNALGHKMISERFFQELESYLNLN